MQSLSDLNSFSQSSLTYTDVRNPNIIFDKATPTSTTFNVPINDTFIPVFGINIVDIINPEAVGVYFELDILIYDPILEPIEYAAWSYLPDHLVLSQPSTGTYRISNILTASDWDYIKQVVIKTKYMYYNNTYYNISFKIGYFGNLYKSWVNSVTPGFNAFSTDVSNITFNYDMIYSPNAYVLYDYQIYSYAIKPKIGSFNHSIIDTIYLKPNKAYSFQIAINVLYNIYSSPVKLKSGTRNNTITFSETITGARVKKSSIHMSTNTNLICTGEKIKPLLFTYTLTSTPKDFVDLVPTGELLSNPSFFAGYADPVVY